MCLHYISIIKTYVHALSYVHTRESTYILYVDCWETLLMWHKGVDIMEANTNGSFWQRPPWQQKTAAKIYWVANPQLKLRRWWKREKHETALAEGQLIPKKLLACFDSCFIILFPSQENARWHFILCFTRRVFFLLVLSHTSPHLGLRHSLS